MCLLGYRPKLSGGVLQVYCGCLHSADKRTVVAWIQATTPDFMIPCDEQCQTDLVRYVSLKNKSNTKPIFFNSLFTVTLKSRGLFENLVVCSYFQVIVSLHVNVNCRPAQSEILRHILGQMKVTNSIKMSNRCPTDIDSVNRFGPFGWAGQWKRAKVRQRAYVQVFCVTES